MNPPVFANRREAGAALAAELKHYRGRGDVVVLALPRGGVPVGYEVARTLDAPLDVFVVRKLGAPGHRELAMGAIASGGVRVLNRDVIGASGFTGNKGTPWRCEAKPFCWSTTASPPARR